MKINVNKLVFNTVMYSLILSIGFVLFKLIALPSENIEEFIAVKSNYSLMLMQCIVGLIAIFIPSFIEKKFKIDIPDIMILLYVVFLYGAIILGEVNGYYYKIANWDTILHCFSGLMLGIVGFSIVDLLNKKNFINLNPLFISMFAFFFAVSLGVFWEIYEFLGDGILELNMQKFATEEGLDYIGRNAIKDTMQDLIVDTISAFVMSVIGYISIKKGNKFMDKVKFEKIRR